MGPNIAHQWGINLKAWQEAVLICLLSHLLKEWLYVHFCFSFLLYLRFDITLFLGCEVHAYDPSVNLEGRNLNFKFYKTAVNATGPTSLGGLIHANGHSGRNITMVKMDIEGTERKGLDAWMDEGSLDQVSQLAMEYHLNNADFEVERKFMQDVQRLNRRHFRIISWEV